MWKYVFNLRIRMLITDVILSKLSLYSFTLLNPCFSCVWTMNQQLLEIDHWITLTQWRLEVTFIIVTHCVSLGLQLN